MEIYTPKESPDNEYRKEKKPEPEERVFPPRSELNEKLPIAEKWMLFVVGFLGFQLFGSLINTFINVFVKNGTISSGTGGALTLFISYLTIVLAFVLLLVFDRERNIIPIGKGFKNYKSYLFGLGGFVCLYLVNLVFTSLYSATVPDIYGANANQDGIVTYAQSSPVIMFLTVVFLAPFLEELTYRGGLLDIVGHKQKYRWLGLVLSAVLFGLIHFNGLIYLFIHQILSVDINSDLSQQLMAQYEITSAAQAWNLYLNEWLNLPIYICMGLILGGAYVLSGDISSSMTTHVLNNLLAMVQVLLLSSSALASTGALSLFAFSSSQPLFLL